MCPNKIESFDVSKTQKEIIEWRALRRKTLRDDYLRQIHHPIKQELTMDHGIYRFGIMRTASEYHTAINGRNIVVGIGGTLAAFVLFMWYADSYKQKQEHLIRTGQIAYADRDCKFNN